MPQPDDLTPVQWFGLRVAAERERRGWSMRELCGKAAMPVAPSTIGRIESGRGATLGNAIKVAGALGLSLDDAVKAPHCGQCYDRPAPGFSCNACGSGS